MKTLNQKLYTAPSDFFQDVDEEGISTSLSSYFATIVDYPKNEVAGAIQFRLFHHDRNSTIDNKELLIAYPLNPQNYTKPVPNQIVKIVELQGYYLYQGLYQSSNNENGDFIHEIFSEDEAGTTDKPNSDNYKALFDGTKEPNQQGQYDLKGFEQKDDIPKIKEKPGDTILKGLQNNDIILSYDENNNPVISLVVDREDNDYNKNNKGIHIYGENDIDSGLEISSDKKENFPNDESNGGGIVLNNDKIRMNAKSGTIFLSANKDISLSSNQSFTIDNGKETVINSPEIYLGSKDAEESVVLGDTLKSLLEEILDAITQLSVATANGTSSYPLNNPKFKIIKRKLGKMLSKQNKTK